MAEESLIHAVLSIPIWFSFLSLILFNLQNRPSFVSLFIFFYLKIRIYFYRNLLFSFAAESDLFYQYFYFAYFWLHLLSLSLKVTSGKILKLIRKDTFTTVKGIIKTYFLSFQSTELFGGEKRLCKKSFQTSCPVYYITVNQ